MVRMVVVIGSTRSSTPTTTPAASTKTMSSGSGVSFIQKTCSEVSRKRNSMPSPAPSWRRNMSPRSCSAAVRASSTRTVAARPEGPVMVTRGEFDSAG